jgi:hypothetical protein
MLLHLQYWEHLDLKPCPAPKFILARNIAQAPGETGEFLASETVWNIGWIWIYAPLVARDLKPSSPPIKLIFGPGNIALQEYEREGSGF